MSCVSNFSKNWRNQEDQNIVSFEIYIVYIYSVYHGGKWEKCTIVAWLDKKWTISSCAPVYNFVSTSSPPLLSGNTLYATRLPVRVFLPGEDSTEGLWDVQAWMGRSRWVPLPLFNPNEQSSDKTNEMACAPNKDSDQPGHPPSLIRVFTVHMTTPWVLSYPLSAQRRLWLDWADAQADLSLCHVHMPFHWFCHETAQICLVDSSILVSWMSPFPVSGVSPVLYSFIHFRNLLL